MFNKREVSIEVDRILDACMDTGVGLPDDLHDYKQYYKDNNMELEYTWFGMWLYDRITLKQIEKEIDRYCKEHKTHSRDASYEVYTKYYKLYDLKVEVGDKVGVSCDDDMFEMYARGRVVGVDPDQEFPISAMFDGKIYKFKNGDLFPTG